MLQIHAVFNQGKIVDVIIDLFIKCGGTIKQSSFDHAEIACISKRDLAFFVSQIPIAVAGDGHCLSDGALKSDQYDAAGMLIIPQVKI